MSTNIPKQLNVPPMPQIKFGDIKVDLIGENTMDKNTHVYCTECAWLIYTDDGIPSCKHEKECNIWDSEDSKSLLDRPYYRPVSKDDFSGEKLV